MPGDHPNVSPKRAISFRSKAAEKASPNPPKDRSKKRSMQAAGSALWPAATTTAVLIAIYSKSDQVQYTPGLTAILAKEHNRARFLEALNNHSCYATTGEKIILSLNIANFSMGSEMETKARPGLEFNRHITGFAIGTQPLTQAVLIRNGKVWKKLRSQMALPSSKSMTANRSIKLPSNPRKKTSCRSPTIIYASLRTMATVHGARRFGCFKMPRAKGSKNRVRNNLDFVHFFIKNLTILRPA